MIGFMLFLTITILNLYICRLGAFNVSNITEYDYQPKNVATSPASILSVSPLSLQPLIPFYNASKPSFGPSIIEDLLNKSHEQLNGKINELENNSNNILVNRSDNSFNSIEYGLYSDYNISPPSISKDDGLEELEGAEMHTNNHQLSNSNQNGHHSRHYNTYQHKQGASLGGSSPLNHFNKYTPTHSSSTPYTNSLNLNYIHSLLGKPTSSNSLSSLLNSNTNSISLTSATSTYGVSLQNGYSSHYYSAPSLSSLNSVQQMQPQKQHQQSLQTNDNQSNLTLNTIDYTGSPSCGRQQVGSREPRIARSREPRIVGGNNTYEGEFPWAVSIQRHGNHHCGGVIVGKRWILTAAHCVRSQLVGNLVVRTGGHTLTRSSNNINSHLERDYFVDQIVMHGDFSRYDNLTASQMKSSANTNNADIALLKLKHDIHWNDLAWPVCFPSREAGNFSGHDAVVIGWGKLNEKSEDFSNELQKVKLTIIDNKVCQNWFRQAGRDMPIDDRIICAGFKNGGKDACHGDSGGPLLSKINGHYVVVGVVSTGIGCARPLLPGLYSRVSSYIAWIENYVT